MSLFPVTAYDKSVYRDELADFLPAKMIDIHAHCYATSGEREPVPGEVKRTVSWPSKVASVNPIEDLLETYSLLLPEQEVVPLIFANTISGPDAPEHLRNGNNYCAEVAAEHNFPALYYSHPAESGAELERAVTAGGFCGLKSYLCLSPAYLPEAEIRIFDFFTPEQLEAANKNKWVVMLHIPRHGRLADPINLAQVEKIAARWPDLKLILAHIGRAYCSGDVGEGLKRIAPLERVSFDFSANCNAGVIRDTIDAVGPHRVLWGSDLPVLRMRTRRICENNFYINLVPPGLYGDESIDPHLREVSEKEAETITFFLYEQLLAFKKAAGELRLTRSEIEAVLYGNAAKILGLA